MVIFGSRCCMVKCAGRGFMISCGGDFTVR